MYIFYKIYLQWIYWTLFFIARCSTIFASDLPEVGNVRNPIQGNEMFQSESMFLATMYLPDTIPKRFVRHIKHHDADSCARQSATVEILDRMFFQCRGRLPSHPLVFGEINCEPCETLSKGGQKVH